MSHWLAVTTHLVVGLVRSQAGLAIEINRDRLVSEERVYAIAGELWAEATMQSNQRSSSACAVWLCWCLHGCVKLNLMQDGKPINVYGVQQKIGSANGFYEVGFARGGRFAPGVYKLNVSGAKLEVEIKGGETIIKNLECTGSRSLISCKLVK